MKLVTAELRVATRGRGFVGLSAEIGAQLRNSGVTTGLCSVWCRHTSASLLVSENADPEVLRDLERYLGRLVPDGDPLFQHVDEGPDDMPAHVRSVLTQTELTVPVRAGRLALGTWQGIFLWEHRRRAHQRLLDLTFLGE